VAKNQKPCVCVHGCEQLGGMTVSSLIIVNALDDNTLPSVWDMHRNSGCHRFSRV